MKKDILKVFGSNLVKMMVTFITTFIVPMVLSVAGYGYLKSYQFYASYIGISHLGFCDGIYLYYGGKNKEEVNRKEISEQWSAIFLYELCISIIFVFSGTIKRDLIIVCVGLSFVPSVLFNFYSYIFQSIGDFSSYTRIVNIYSLINMIVNLSLVMAHVYEYRIYMCLYVCVDFVPMIVGTVLFSKLGWIHLTSFKFDVFQKYVKGGILLMIGNFAYSLFIGIDKWFIKFTLSIEDFSMYSFASQMLTIVNMFITPIAMTLFSTMAKRKDQKFEIKIKKILICLLMIIPEVIFVLKFIISNFIKQYNEAINITSALLVTQIFLSLNVAVFVNLYKVYKKQKEYFLRLVFSLGVAAITDLLVTLIHPNLMLYAFSTMFSCFVWMALNINYFKYLVPKYNEFIYVIGLLAVYLGTLCFTNTVLRVSVYFAIYIIWTKLFMPEEWLYLTNELKRNVTKIKRQ